MANFTLELPLETEQFQEDILNQRFRVGCDIYNGLVDIIQKRYNEMIKTRKYRRVVSAFSADKEFNKALYKDLYDILNEYRFTLYDFYKDVAKFNKYYSTKSGGFMTVYVCRSIAAQVYRSFDDLIKGNSKKVKKKSYNKFNSLSGQNNLGGLKYSEGYVIWRGLKLKVIHNEKSEYENQAMTNKICYCRILRKKIRNKQKFYVQLIFKGTPPIKRNLEYSINNRPNKPILLELTPVSVKISSDYKTETIELAKSVHVIEYEKQLIKKKLNKHSKKTKQTIKYQELYRKSTVKKKQEHELLANYIISQGSKILISNFDEYDKLLSLYKGKTYNRSPNLFLLILKQKLNYLGQDIEIVG